MSQTEILVRCLAKEYPNFLKWNRAAIMARLEGLESFWLAEKIDEWPRMETAIPRTFTDEMMAEKRYRTGKASVPNAFF